MMLHGPLAPGHAADPHRRALAILGAHEVAAALQGRERELIALAARTIVAHARGATCVQPAQSMLLPGRHSDRLVARAGCLGGAQTLAGLQWVASFPDNAARGLPRHSGLIVLNDGESGRPRAVVEASLIGSQRTAAVAALAARVLHGRPRIGTLGLFGCGLLGREIVRFIAADDRVVDAILLYDRNRAYSRSLADALRARGLCAAVGVSHSRKQMVASCDVLVFATAATRPSLDSIERSPRDATILHVSPRDLTANAVLAADNVADDAEAALHSPGALQRAAQLTGRRDLVRATLAQVLLQESAPRSGERPVIFHPSGLPAVDLAIAAFVADHCSRTGAGVVVPEFLA